MRNLVNKLVGPLMDWLRGRDIDEREKLWQLEQERLRQEKLEQENSSQEAEGCSSCGNCGCK